MIIEITMFSRQNGNADCHYPATCARSKTLRHHPGIGEFFASPEALGSRKAKVGL
jgi:hypothetical protein